MIEFHGLIHRFPKKIKSLILVFLVVLSIGFYGGLSFVNKTTSFQTNEIESQYLGNENDENAEIMKFKKSEQEIVAIVHNHILSMSVLFFILAILVSFTSISKKIKHFLMFEPLISVLLTFGGIYFLWKGITWFKYVIMISGILMTFSFVASTTIISYQLLFSKK